jgi:predicted LPLAT superfamily acyltransferase
MTSVPLILHYLPTLHPFTNLIQFCPIPSSPYILVQILNPPGHYIMGLREYYNLYIHLDV